MKIDTNYWANLIFHFDEMKTILWKFWTDGYSLEFDA